MANLILPPSLDGSDKIRLLRDAAADDIADANELTHDELADLEAIRAPKSPPTVPKLGISNDCIFNCSYCSCRAGLECRQRYTATPREMAEIAVQAAKSNPTLGVFLTSGICKNADYTEELIVETLRIMRRDLRYTGYIHAKIMPGADPDLIEQAGWLADRLSVNIELPHSDGYSVIAKQKNKTNILTPMEAISRKIRDHTGEFNASGRRFARSGQTTQMIVGAMKENDRTTMTLSGALYRKYRLRRVYYSPFHLPRTHFDFFPEKNTPSWRTRRLYQADRLMQLYGFTVEDLLPENAPNLPYDLDPKAAWALRHLDQFPVEVNTADYETLLRVPGIGVTYAKRIIQARRLHTLTHELLRKIGVSLKRSRYFITCNGKYTGGRLLDSPSLRPVISDIGAQTKLFGWEDANAS